MEFGETLKLLRKERNLSHEQLGEKIGYSRAIIGFWENGHKLPTLGALKALADFFDVTLDYLTGRTDEADIQTISNMKNKHITIAAKSSGNSVHNITIELTPEQMSRLEKEFSKK